MTLTVPSKLHPRLQRATNAVVGEWNRVGTQTRFYATTLAEIPDAVVNYRTELLRLIAQMGLGVAALAMIGGTVVIVGFLTMTTGALVAVQGYNQLQSVGIEALTGFASAYFNVRLIVPGTASVALSATGLVSPKPVAPSRAVSMPCATSHALTASARSPESFWL